MNRNKPHRCNLYKPSFCHHSYHHIMIHILYNTFNYLTIRNADVALVNLLITD